MVVAYHVNFAMYGFWLPNDPRGSNSDFVRAPHLLPYGDAKKVEHRRSVASAPHNAALRAAAKQALLYEPVKLSGRQALSVANGFAAQVRTSGFTIYACAILPKHVHLVVARHRYRIEQVVNLLKGAATRQLLADGLHPFQSLRDSDGSMPSMWGRNCRKIFLSTPADVIDEIDYVQRNPTKEGKRPQNWKFIAPYNAPR